MNTSFNEKSAWIQFLSLLVIGAIYGVSATNLMENGATNIGAFVPLLIKTGVLLILVMIVSHIVLAIITKPEKADERDLMITVKSLGGSSRVLEVCVLVAIIAIINSVSIVWVMHGLVISLILAELVMLAMQIIFYRRGF